MEPLRKRDKLERVAEEAERLLRLAKDADSDFLAFLVAQVAQEARRQMGRQEIEDARAPAPASKIVPLVPRRLGWNR